MNAPVSMIALRGARAADPATVVRPAPTRRDTAQAATDRLTQAQRRFLAEHRRDFRDALGLAISGGRPSATFGKSTSGPAARRATARLTPEEIAWLHEHRRVFRAHLEALGDPRHRLYCGNRH